MKPLAARIAIYTSITPVETTMVQAYERILWALGQERAMLEESVWVPRLSARRWRRLHTRHLQLLDTIAIVRAMRDRHLGNTPAPIHRSPRLNRPDAGYGE